MAKIRSNGKKNSIFKLHNLLFNKIKKSLLLVRRPNSCHLDDNEEVTSESTNVPVDVKEGHFAVVAKEGEEAKRFVVPLSYLKHPIFVILLERAAEEYGFQRKGALTIPCRPSVIETILAEKLQFTYHDHDAN